MSNLSKKAYKRFKKNKEQNKKRNRSRSKIYMASSFANYNDIYKDIDNNIVKMLMAIRDNRINYMTTTGSASYDCSSSSHY